MWELDCKQSWAPKTWCFWTVVLENTLESPLDCKEIQPVHPKGNQSWIFIRRTNVEAETPILWPPDVKNWLIWKDLMLEKIEHGRRRADRGWDYWMASPTQWARVWVVSGSWWWTRSQVHKESNMAEWLNWTEDLCMESRKMVLLKLFSWYQWIPRHWVQTMDMLGCRREEEECGMYGERNMETYITTCKIDSQWVCCMTQGTESRAL